MVSHTDPNAMTDAPVKRQILLVLLGFVVATAAIAIVVNSVV